MWVTGKLAVHGVVSVDGGGTQCFGMVRSKSTVNRADKDFIAGAHGGGGGAGGSVLVYAQQVEGIGAIYARGGSALGGCHLAWPGGGGGGGAIALHVNTSAAYALQLSAAGGSSGGGSDASVLDGMHRNATCPSGGAGTVFVSSRGGESLHLSVDNYARGRHSALTPYPTVTGSLDVLVVRRGATLTWPQESLNAMGEIRSLAVEEGAAMLQGLEGSRHLSAQVGFFPRKLTCEHALYFMHLQKYVTKCRLMRIRGYYVIYIYT